MRHSLDQKESEEDNGPGPMQSNFPEHTYSTDHAATIECDTALTSPQTEAQSLEVATAAFDGSLLAVPWWAIAGNRAPEGLGRTSVRKASQDGILTLMSNKRVSPMTSTREAPR